VVLNGGWVKDGDIGIITFLQHSAPVNAQIRGGKGSHLSDCVRDSQQFVGAHIPGIDAREVAEGARVGAELEKDAIRAFGVGVGSKADPGHDNLLLEIVFAH